MAQRSGRLQRRIGTSNSRRVVVLAVPPVDEFDLVCPIQVFGAANRLAGKPVYGIEVVTNGKDLKVQGEGRVLSFLAETHYTRLKKPFDSLLLVCGLGTRNARDRELFAWLRRVAPSFRRLGSVCVGSFLLAEAGLLNGKRATSHWRFAKELGRRYPLVKVESDLVWVKDENIYTSAGISAGIDLALAWVEEDCGAAVAQEVARELVLFLRRSGGQKQLSASSTSKDAVLSLPSTRHGLSALPNSRDAPRPDWSIAWLARPRITKHPCPLALIPYKILRRSGLLLSLAVQQVLKPARFNRRFHAFTALTDEAACGEVVPCRDGRSNDSSSFMCVGPIGTAICPAGQ